MKKSKEYAKEIVEHKDGLNAGIGECFFSLLKEIEYLSKVRNIRSNDALASIIREIDDKWKAICRHVNKHTEERTMEEAVFIHLLSDKVPGTTELLDQYKGR